MMRSVALALALAASADASGNPVIAGYQAGSLVWEHNRIDLSANAIEQFVGGYYAVTQLSGKASMHSTVTDAAAGLQKYLLAEDMYNNGGGKSSAWVKFLVTSTDTASVNTLNTYTCTLTPSGGTGLLLGTLAEKSTVGTGSGTLKVYLSDSGWNSKQCGKVPFQSATETWTQAGATGSATASYVGGDIYKAQDCPTGNAKTTAGTETVSCSSSSGGSHTFVSTLAAGATSYGSRTLKGFSTAVESKMIAANEPEAIAVKNFHKVSSYGDMTIQMAFKALSVAGINAPSFGTCTGQTSQADATTCAAAGGTWVQGTAMCKHGTTHAPIMVLTGANYAAKQTDCKTNLGGVVTDFDIWSGTEIGLVTQVIKKMAVFTNAWLYTVHEFEDAIDDCTASLIANNDAGVHAWDEGVAFWTGSLVGTTLQSSTNGNMNYMLANKRCKNFKTCVGGTATGQSTVNINLFEMFTNGYNAIHADNCGQAQVVLNQVIPQMTVPLIQGTLRYAYLIGEASGTYKELGEGYAFMMSVIHRVGQCSMVDANTIYAALDVIDAVPTTYALGGSATFETVKTAFENNYGCMGVTCADVGGYVDSNGAYRAKASPCVDPVTAAAAGTSTTEEKLPSWAVAAMAIAGFLAVAFGGMMIAFKNAKDKTIKMYETLKKESGKV
jgi:hypothetical protein